MARFRFRFASVLKLRKTREEAALRGLGVAQRAYQGELATKRKLLEDLARGLERRERLGEVTIGPIAYQLEDEFVVGTRQRLRRQDQVIVRATRAVEKALRAYLGAKRQLRMLETIEERHRLEFRKEQQKREQRAMDDLSTMRARFAAMFDLEEGVAS